MTQWKIKTIEGYMDVDNALYQLLEISAVPQSLLFNSEGNFVELFEGKPSIEEMQKALDEAMK